MHQFPLNGFGVNDGCGHDNCECGGGNQQGPPPPPSIPGYQPAPGDRPNSFICGVNKAKGVAYLQFPHPTVLVELNFYDLMKLRENISKAGWMLYQTHMENLKGGPSGQFPLGRFGFTEHDHPGCEGGYDCHG